MITVTLAEIAGLVDGELTGPADALVTGKVTSTPATSSPATSSSPSGANGSTGTTSSAPPRPPARWPP